MKIMIGVVRIVAALALGVIASTSTHAQPAASRDGRIDGSSAANFEASVAALQRGLPSRRREDFEIALAVIWTSNALGPSGLDQDGDGDGDADVIDSQTLAKNTYDLLTDIQRGDVLSSIERRERKGGKYTAADYVRQLDGLGYDEVLDLAGRPDRVSLPSTKQSPDAITISATTGKALNEAIEAFNLRKLADARRALERLTPSRLSPYEQSKVEQILCSVSYGEGKLAEAREHLQNAVSAGGLNQQEVAGALVQIRAIENQLAGNPPGLLAMPKFPE